MKRTTLYMSLILLVFTVLVGCSQKSDNASSSTASASSDTGIATQEEKSDAKPTKVVFYGDIKEFPSFVPMMEKLKEDFKGKYDIETIPVDWGNLDKIVRSGIASGQPADIYAYWPGSLTEMVKSNMVTDLTPYLDADDGEWRKQFGTMLNIGKYGDKIYGIPISGVFPLIFANQDLLDKAGVTIPDNWNWDQFMNVLKKIKEQTEVYPFGASNEMAGVIPRESMTSLGVSQGIDYLTSPQIPTTDPIYATMLTNVKQLGEGDLWYPGKGALTIKRDEELSAFYQGKVALIVEASSLTSKVIENAKFKLTALPIPTMGDKLAYGGGADGFIIPANAPHKEAAIEVMKKFSSPEYQQFHADAGFIVSSSHVKQTNPVSAQISDLFANVSPNLPLFFNGAKMFDYVMNQLMPNLYLKGMSIEDIQKDLEKLRQEHLAE